jgi:hypothetical protein
MYMYVCMYVCMYAVHSYILYAKKPINKIMHASQTTTA